MNVIVLRLGIQGPQVEIQGLPIHKPSCPSFNTFPSTIPLSRPVVLARRSNALQATEF
jgi:hypothetical protein